MKFKELPFTLLLLFCSNLALLHAQLPLRVSMEDFPRVAEHLVCEYSGEVNVTEQNIIDFLESMVAQTGPGATLYAPPIPELVISQGDMVSYQWDAVPQASSYSVGGLGLVDGMSNTYVSPESPITINDLEHQLYLMAFRTDGPDVKYKDLIIIIEDKDLGITNVEGIPCLCTKEEETIFPNKPTQNCTFKAINSVAFSWSKKECPVSKYTFEIDGIIASQNFNYTYSFLYEEAPFPSDDIVHNFSDCNPSFPILRMATGNGQAQPLVPLELKIGMGLDGVHFDFYGSETNSINVTAKDCGCYTKAPKGTKGKGGRQGETEALPFLTDAALQITPNPFTEEFTAHIELRSPQVVRLQIFDLNGKLVKEEKKSLASGKHQLHLSSKGLGKGLYQVRLKTSDQIYQQKVLKF